MSLFITSLNSGSNGNCYYVGNEREAVLVDAGISCREIEKRMKRLGLSMEKIRAIFVSHEHSDHIKGIPVLSKKYRLPVYITPATLRFGRLYLEKELIRSFNSYVPVSIGGLLVTGFPKLHDAADPFSFVVEHGHIKVGVFTDIGRPCEHVVRNFRQCHAAFLESNYDEQMLEHGGYPYQLKNRIRGGNGHLSNKQALELFLSHRAGFMTHLILSHLSKNNNCPKLVGELFKHHAGSVKTIVASRFEETAVYQIHQLRMEQPQAAYAPRLQQMEFSFA
ncbi:MAG TPA: MBL fold metallo-hydrolase [Flavisolibacter sp.]|nr:MBL fold metallo-hydrolase [Flavisolibacter sp.]